jgi:hypothetical protein
MIKTLAVGLLLLSVAVPAFAKPRDIYPVSCDDLWAAVKDTLGNRSNYGVSSINDLDLRASFVVVGNLTVYTDRVALSATDGGCKMTTDIKEVGAENSDWQQFHNRVGKSLKKLQASKTAKTAATPKSPGE